MQAKGPGGEAAGSSKSLFVLWRIIREAETQNERVSGIDAAARVARLQMN